MTTPLERLDTALSDAAIDELIAAAQDARVTYPNDTPIAGNLDVLQQVLLRLRNIVVGRRPVVVAEASEEPTAA